MNILLEIQYLPPVQYFSKFCKYDKLIIDDNEIFQKQSYRNRCTIIGANNIQSLIIPLKQGKTKAKIREVEIDNAQSWQREHWHAIKSAYGKAAYYEHYAPYFEPFYNKKFDLLLDFDLELIKLCMKLLKLQDDKLARASTSPNTELKNFRNAIHPKAKFRLMDEEFFPQSYVQVFPERFGFIPNPSIIDLIFNAGPVAIGVLEESIV